ncbi:unnamed protein product, partial [Ostreobium quekettii]
AIERWAWGLSKCLWPPLVSNHQSPQGVNPDGLRGIHDSEAPGPPSRSVLDLFSLEGSVAFVTGGSRGIGRSTCLALASAGADVMVTDQPNEAKWCKSVVEDIECLGRRAATDVCDVRDLISVKRAVQTCKE